MKLRRPKYVHNLYLYIHIITIIQAVSTYFSTASLPSHALGLICPDLPNIISHQQRQSDKNIDLSAEADWLVAIRKTLARQSTYNNVISEILKGITRIVGWMLLTLVRKYN